MSTKALYGLYRWLQKAIAPKLLHSQRIYEDVLGTHCAGAITWLDLGCGHHILPPWRLKQERRLVEGKKLIVGMDYDHLSLTKHKTIDNRVRAGMEMIPFRNDTFDLVSSNMVFEHLEKPADQLKEIARVLKPGGLLIFHTPNVRGYTTRIARMIPEGIKDRIIYLLQGREEDDIFPTHYRINSSSSIEEMAGLTGFSVEQLKYICSSAQLIVVPPLVVFELLWIRFLLTRPGRRIRTNFIAILRKLE